jgi:hypothetical protein
MYLSVEEAAVQVGLSAKRIKWLVTDGRLRSTENGRVFAEDVLTLKKEQGYLQAGEACTYLGVTRRQLILLIKKGVVTPRNTLSKNYLFDKAELDERLEEVRASLSIEAAANEIGHSVRHTYRLVAEGTITSIETVYGPRIPREELAIYMVTRGLQKE